MRGAGAAAVLANAVPAGIMASSSGSAIDTPSPRSTARRDRCFLGDEMHVLKPLNYLCAVCVLLAMAALAAERFWNWSLFTMCITIEEKR